MSLAGRGVVVTRPRELARALAERIERSGGRAIVFPALEIEALPEPGALRRLPQFDLAIFASPSAVQCAFQWIGARWPAGLPAFAVGAGTREELARRGVRELVAPGAGADSEALLALPQLELAQVRGRRVLLVRGEGGRALLAETLGARGATVEHAPCYRRVRPAADPAPLLAAWKAGAVHAVSVTSAQALDNLLAMLGEEGARRLRETPLFAGHERIAAHAARLGLAHAQVAGPGDDALVERLVAFFS